jgi:sRNA-binding protein
MDKATSRPPRISTSLRFDLSKATHPPAVEVMTMETKHHATLRYFAERFPQTFVLEIYQPHRPLKVGIVTDLLAHRRDLHRRVVGKILAAYTGRIMYLRGMAEGAARFDLDGNPAGAVSAADAEHAAARLAEILAARQARRMAALAKGKAGSGSANDSRGNDTRSASSGSSCRREGVLRLPPFRR